jgi:rhodanese-related sulfurtransferase
MGLPSLFSRGAERNGDEIAHEDLAAALKSEACVLVDVREPHEFSTGHSASII